MAFKAGFTIIVGIITSICSLHEALGDDYNTFVGAPLHKTGLLKGFTNIRRQHDSNEQTEITNEKTKIIEDYPFIVMLAEEKNEIGLGSIIGTRWVLTAAHCFINMQYNLTDLEMTLLRVYSNTSYWMSPTSEMRKVVEYHNHELYDIKTLKNDISVVKVDREFTAKNEKYTSYADPKYYYEPMSSALFIGWHRSHFNQEKLSLLPQKSCKRIYHNGDNEITSNHVCAMGWAQTTCLEDSGGPLYQHGRIIGVLSSSTCKNYSLSVNVFTRISEFNGFIQRTISGTR